MKQPNQVVRHILAVFAPDCPTILAVSNNILHVLTFVQKLTKKKKSARKMHFYVNHHRKKRKWKSNKNENHNVGFIMNYAGKQKNHWMK